MPINPEDFDAQVYCKTAHFRDDLSDLCQSCQLREIITEGIENQIIWQARQQKSILTDSQFEAYCKSEIGKAQRAIEENHLFVRRNREGQKRSGQRIIVNFPGVTLYHIWNKERIKTLNQLLIPQLPDINQQADHDPPTVSVVVPALAPSDEKEQVGSTKRKRILIHFYEDGEMVKRSHKDYNDYNKFCTSRKRIAYSNGSLSKLKPLIEDIEAIRNLLSEKAKQVADRELTTLRGYLTVEK